MKAEHEAEFRMHEKLGPAGMLIWAMAVLDDVKLGDYQGQVRDEHIDDVREVIARSLQRLKGTYPDDFANLMVQVPDQGYKCPHCGEVSASPQATNYSYCAACRQFANEQAEDAARRLRVLAECWALSEAIAPDFRCSFWTPGGSDCSRFFQRWLTIVDYTGIPISICEQHAHEIFLSISTSHDGGEPS